MHKQTWVKVNAPVDFGIASIVSALSGFPELETLESCEGNQDTAGWVCFRYGAYWQHPWKDLAKFTLGYLVPALARVVGDDASLRIQATPNGQFFGELSVRPGAANRVRIAIRRLAKAYRARSITQSAEVSDYCGSGRYGGPFRPAPSSRALT